MKNNRIRFSRYLAAEKSAFVDQQAKELLDRLIAAGAKFYGYCGQEIMYLDGWMTDVFKKSEVLSALKWKLAVTDFPYALDTAESLRFQAMALRYILPEGLIGEVNGIKEPKLKMTKYLGVSVRNWIKEVVESGMFTPAKGNDDEN